MPKSRRIY